MEMTSSGSGSQFLLRQDGGEEEDVRRGGTRECAVEDRREAPSWLCHMVHTYPQKGALERTHLYWVLVKEANSDIGGGVRRRSLILLLGICLRAG
jgi:hypothetical protein